MSKLATSTVFSLPSVATSDGPQTIGAVLTAYGSKSPLPSRLGMAVHPDVNLRAALTLLSRISGSPPSLLTILHMPNNGEAKSLISGVDWRWTLNCTPEALAKAEKVVMGLFFSADPDEMSEKLRALFHSTHKREKVQDAIDGMFIAYAKKLAAYPGDIVLDVLEAWTDDPDKGRFWPLVAELIGAIQPRMAERLAIATHIWRLQIRMARGMPLYIPPPDNVDKDAPERAKQVEEATAWMHEPPPPDPLEVAHNERTTAERKRLARVEEAIKATVKVIPTADEPDQSVVLMLERVKAGLEAEPSFLDLYRDS